MAFRKWSRDPNMAKTTLVNIFRNFTVKTVAPGMEDVIPIAELVLRPSDSIHVQFKPRNRTVGTTSGAWHSYDERN